MASEGGKQAGPARRWLRPLLWLLGWALIAVPIARAQLVELAVANRLPGQALLLDSGHARALSSLAAAFQAQGEQDRAVTLAQAALTREPLNLPAIRTIGLARQQTGDQAGADRIMFLAGGLGWRDVAVQLWLLKAYALKDDVMNALRRADALARTNRLPEMTFPVFMASLTDDRLRSALAQSMADRPLWRSQFFHRVRQLPADQLPFVEQLVTELARRGSPVTPPERALQLGRLVEVGEAPTAYRYWLADHGATRAVASAAPWDGGFEQVQPVNALVAPFEWRITPESTGIVSIGPGVGDGQQLTVAPGGDFNGSLVSQTLVLRPGRYRLMARVNGDGAAAGLHWTLRCVGQQDELVLDAGPGGAEFGRASFAVPATGCAAQFLSLDISSGGGDAIDNVTIDDVSIRRIG